MSMMEKIRRSTDSTVMKVIFIIIVLVFVFWGVGQTRGMQTTQAVATVNGERITDSELQRIMRSKVRDMGGSTLDEDQVQELSRQVLEGLILQRAMVQEALKIGLEVSTEEMQRYVLEIDAFKDADGKFSSELYGRSLKRMGLKKGAFEEQIREEMLRNKLRDVVVAGVGVSDAEVRDLYDRTATQAELQYVRVLDKAIAATVEVSDADIDDFLAREAAQVTAAYEADKARLYSKPRRIRYSRILLRKGVAGVSDDDTRARMEQIRADAEGGADFGELARKWSEDLSAATGGKAGLMPEPQMDPALANAAITAGAGKLSGIVDTERGFVLLKVDEILAKEETPLDDVKRDIARELFARSKASSIGGEQAEQVLAAWKDAGAPPTDLLAELGLELQAAGPTAPTDIYLPGVGLAPDVSQAITDQAREGLIDAVFPIDGGRLVVGVSRWQGADEAQFEQLKEIIRYQVLQQKQQQVLQQWQQGLVAQARIERFMH